MGGQVSQLFSYRFTFVITRRVAARRMSKINGSHLELFPRTFAFFSRVLTPSLSFSFSPLRLASIRSSLPVLVTVTSQGFIINVSIPRYGRQSRSADANFYQIIRTQCSLYLNVAAFYRTKWELNDLSYRTVNVPSHTVTYFQDDRRRFVRSISLIAFNRKLTRKKCPSV